MAVELELSLNSIYDNYDSESQPEPTYLKF